MNHVVIYTDGACKGNPGPGGWGVFLRAGGHEKELWGGERETTNNRMELTAVIEALASLKRRCRVTLHTDSQYVRNGITTIEEVLRVSQTEEHMKALVDDSRAEALTGR